MRLDRLLASPRRLITLLFCFQAAFWYVAMPQYPLLPGAAQRYESGSAVLKFGILFALLMAGMLLGENLIDVRAGEPSPDERTAHAQRLRALLPFAIPALLIAAIGEAVYVRHLLADPGAIVRAWVMGDLVHIGDQTGAERIVGISSLDNLFLFATGLLALGAFSPAMESSRRRAAKRALVCVGIAAGVHALLVAARLFLLYYGTVVGAAYILQSSKARVISLARVALLSVCFFAFVWTAETLRSGLIYAKGHDVGLFSSETQSYVRDVLVEGYAASDFNNALIVLDCRPSMQLVSTTALKSLGSTERTHDQCPHWQSAFGTVNVLGLWWFDAGWFAAVIALIIGAWIGVVTRAASRGDPVAQLLFLVSYPGVFTMLRANYFGTSIFLLSIGAVTISALLVPPIRARRSRLGEVADQPA